MRSVTRSLAAVICLLLPAASIHAQSRSQVADSLKRVVAGYRSDMLAADTTSNAQGAVDTRLKLAPLVKPKEALRLLEQAVVLADSARLGEEEAARTALAVHLSRMGNHRRAYEEAMELVGLVIERSAEQAEEWGARHDEDVGMVEAERDRLQLQFDLERKDATSAIAQANERAERWMWIAVGAGALLLIIVLLLVLRSSRAAQRTKKELAELREEIEALKAAPKNRIRETVPAPAPIADAAPVVELAPPSVPAADPLALAFLRKMAPERLGVLRDARARGDHEKVVRVVHTLKPQLVALDAGLFTDLCAAITAKDAAIDTPEWNADVDRLEKEVERAIA